MAWRVIIADDEALIRNGMKHLIDWSALDAEIVALAEDGRQLEEYMELYTPDIVVSDIKMPEQTGLEVLSAAGKKGWKAQFIFISGYSEFSYAKEAMQNGAIDYLLKPVRADELEQAVKKAIKKRTDQDTVQVFREERSEIRELLDRAEQSPEMIEAFPQAFMEKYQIDMTGKMFAGVCIGIRPDLSARMEQTSFERFNLIRFAVYNRISELLQNEIESVVIRREDACMQIMVFFSKEEEALLYESRIMPLKKQVEEEYQVRLLVGIGMPTGYPEQMENAMRTAKYAFDLYYFEERPVILFQEIHKSFEESNEEFNRMTEQVFRTLVTRNGEFFKNVMDTLNLIRDMFYGNRFAAENRCMHFTGMIAEKLMQYHMIQKDFYELQDELQEKIEREVTFRGVTDVIMQYYEELLRHISETGKNRDSILIEDVKQYIREHYMEEISISRLSEIACVSKNYFSAMFKKETGMNYKAYLTQIRMEAALKLLQETDDKTYEISEKIGYNNVRRFVDAFKQIYSVTPAEYRKSLRGE